MNKYLMMVTAVLFVSFAVFAQELNNTVPDEDDFVVKAASGGMMEVELGKLAQEKGQSQEVKEFGELMERDHSKANDELKNIAQQNNIQLPDSMLDKHREHVEELSEKSGAEFDETYMDLMAEDHEKDVKLFEEASENYDNQEVKDWAEKTLSVLEEHHELAKSVKEKLK
jgi:putative membrane protein